jgi:hypothetical protein
VPARSIVILEVKAALGDEDRVRELLYPLDPRATRSSKYVLGCQAIGLLRGAHYGEI